MFPAFVVELFAPVLIRWFQVSRPDFRNNAPLVFRTNPPLGFGVAHVSEIDGQVFQVTVPTDKTLPFNQALPPPGSVVDDAEKSCARICAAVTLPATPRLATS
jgi:hypothetical protein